MRGGVEEQVFQLEWEEDVTCQCCSAEGCCMMLCHTLDVGKEQKFHAQVTGLNVFQVPMYCVGLGYRTMNEVVKCRYILYCSNVGSVSLELSCNPAKCTQAETSCKQNCHPRHLCNPNSELHALKTRNNPS